MLIVGAGGLASEVINILSSDNEIVFFDNINKCPDLLFSKFKILKTELQVLDFFNKVGNKYILGVGNPKVRERLFEYFDNLGGELTSVISEYAFIGKFKVEIGNGACIFPGVKISNDVVIGEASLIYYNSIITHNCKIGDFVEISTAASLLGHVNVGNCTSIGSNATILPKINIGNNVTIAAGAVVTKDVPDNSIAIGIPAIIKSKL
jgi:sugar O-acyltransferase (sialic acid O-acetyltransferase NeuD family)